MLILANVDGGKAGKTNAWRITDSRNIRQQRKFLLAGIRF